MRIVKGILVGLAIFFVSTLSYGLIRGTIQLYRIAQAVKAGATPKDGVGEWYTGGLIHNPYLWLAFFSSIAIGIWIVKRHGIPSAMKRLLISTFVGFAFVACLMIVGTRFFSPTSRTSNSLEIIVILLYWPGRLLVVGGLDCPNADLIAEKLTCAGMSLGISCLAYSAVAYVLLSLVKKPLRPLGRRSLSNGDQTPDNANR